MRDLARAEELTECPSLGKTNSPRRTSKQGWFELRRSYVLLLHFSSPAPATRKAATSGRRLAQNLKEPQLHVQ
jgi:hypothetical protein